MTTREEFLSRIARKLGRERLADPPERTVKGPPDFWKGFSLSGEERVRRFVQELEQLGGKAVICHSMEDLHRGLRELLQEIRPDSILAWKGKNLEQWNLDSILSEWNVLEWNEEVSLQDAARSMVGITGVDYAIANTGTIVLCTDAEKFRSVSLLPIMHIALIRSDQIKSRMGEVLQDFSSYKGLDAPSSIHFISGPSRSADIENDLTIGVHGPAALYAYIFYENY